MILAGTEKKRVLRTAGAEDNNKARYELILLQLETI